MKTTFLSLILAAAQWSVLAGNDSPENYVAHEWGTFTSVQGADGVLIPWNPLETTKLPKFVYEDRKSTRLNSSHLVISYAVFCLKKKTDRHGRLSPPP